MAGSSEKEATAVLLTTKPQYLPTTAGIVFKYTSKFTVCKSVHHQTI
jgi:hypothetical protein